MKYLPLALVLCLFCVSGAAAPEPAPLTTPPTTAAPALTQAAAPVKDAIKLTAPETCVVGELVVFDASESGSESLVWEIKPETEDFEIFGKKACFSSRAPGEYLIIVAGSVGSNVPALTTHLLCVEGDVIVTGIARQMKAWAKLVSSEKKAEEALKFAQSFRALAGAEIPIDKMIESTANANRRALGESLEAWKPFLDKLGLYLNTLAEDGKLKTSADYKRTWIDLADTIEECFQ